jgi:hypothetical protein
VATLAVSILAFCGAIPEDVLFSMVLSDWSPFGLIGHQFLHGGVMHLLGNMIFLFVFGNAICGVMNSFLYAAVYIGLARKFHREGKKLIRSWSLNIATAGEQHRHPVGQSQYVLHEYICPS